MPALTMLLGRGGKAGAGGRATGLPPRFAPTARSRSLADAELGEQGVDLGEGVHVGLALSAEVGEGGGDGVKSGLTGHVEISKWGDGNRLRWAKKTGKGEPVETRLEGCWCPQEGRV